jgi:hypothetical protein
MNPCQQGDPDGVSSDQGNTQPRAELCSVRDIGHCLLRISFSSWTVVHNIGEGEKFDIMKIGWAQRNLLCLMRLRFHSSPTDPETKTCGKKYIEV